MKNLAKRRANEKSSLKPKGPSDVTADTGDIRKTGAYKKLMGTLKGKEPDEDDTMQRPSQGAQRTKAGGPGVKVPGLPPWSRG